MIFVDINDEVVSYLCCIVVYYCKMWFFIDLVVVIFFELLIMIGDIDQVRFISCNIQFMFVYDIDLFIVEFELISIVLSGYLVLVKFSIYDNFFFC